ncbi:MAG: MFS transporter [Burkholderiaceae bacterium]
MNALSPRRRAGVWLIGLGAAIGPLDFALNVAFPAITQAFALQTQTIRWMALCYVTTYGALMLAFGALGDRIGHLRVFRAGLLLAALALTLAALAPSYPLLLAARVLQGVAVALTWSCAPALVMAVYDRGAAEGGLDAARLAALSTYGRLQALASAAAPLLGGLSMLWLGWAGVFWFRIPLVLVAWVAVPWFVAGRAAPKTNAAAPRGVWALLRRVQHARPAFAWINLGNTVVQFTGFTVPLITPYYLTRELHWSVLAAGATVSLWAAGVWLGSALAAALGRRFASQPLLWASALGAVLTLWPFVLWPAADAAGASAWGTALGLTLASAGSLAWIGLSMAVQGVVLGVYQVAYADAVVAALPDDARGVAGSLTIVTRTLGVILGATVWLWMLQQGDAPQQFMSWFRGLFVVAAAGGLLLVGAVAWAATVGVRASPDARSAGT